MEALEIRCFIISYNYHVFLGENVNTTTTTRSTIPSIKYRTTYKDAPCQEKKTSTDWGRVYYNFNGIGAYTKLLCQIPANSQSKELPILLASHLFPVKYKMIIKSDRSFKESHHLLMKICGLLCQFHHHSLIKELAYAYVFTHSLQDGT